MHTVDTVVIIIIFVSLYVLFYVYTVNKQESFTVADANDINNYKKLRQETMNYDPSFAADKIDNPNKSDIVDIGNIGNINNKNDSKTDNQLKNYEIIKPNDDFSIKIDDSGIKNDNLKTVDKTVNKTSYITSADFGWSEPYPTVSCANSSINNRYLSGPKQLLPTQISCGSPNKLTAENYYKTHFTATAVPLEDYMVRGANYAEYSNNVHPSKINIRILSLNTKGLPEDQTKYRNLPIGANFGFHNTPAMRMP